MNAKLSLKSFFIFLCCISAVLTLIQGETPFKMVLSGVKNYFFLGENNWNPLIHERIPRLIVLFCTGACLAVSGAAMQAVFQNALASPSVLGISSGGVLAVVLAIVLQVDTLYPFIVPSAAFLGCLATLLFVYFLSLLQKGRQLTNLILTGIAVSTLLIATQSLILYVLRDHWQLIQAITEWESASTIDRNWNHVHTILPLAIAGLTGCWYYREELNLLSLGEEEAASLGVDVKRVRWRLFLSIAMLTGGSIAALGMVPFFGLIVPHIIRYFAGPDNRSLIPLSILGGGALLTSLDAALRWANLNFLSIGNLCGLCGGIFFLLLLFKKEQRSLLER